MVADPHPTQGQLAETEAFEYDFLDRLLGVESTESAYDRSYSYNEIGNLMSVDSTDYTYSLTQPHAVESVGAASYEYDNNGNMIDRDGQTITWDAENRPIEIVTGVSTTSFVYDGDGKRVQKTEGEVTILYINKFYEINLTADTITVSYYLGGKLIAQRVGGVLLFIHQDSLGSSSVVSDEDGVLVDSIKYHPFGETKEGDVPTDMQFTGQRNDGTGLYYYGARYYDPAIGRFISADPVVQLTKGVNLITGQLTINVGMLGTLHSVVLAPNSSQTLNRYSYVANNPLKYNDPSGLWTLGIGLSFSIGLGGGFTFSFGVVFDNHGGIGATVSGGGGAYAGAGAGGGVQLQWTDAETIEDLKGTSLQTGASYASGLGGGAEWITANSYQGVNLNIGVGVTCPHLRYHMLC